MFFCANFSVKFRDFFKVFSFLFAAKRELALWRRVDRKVNIILSTEGVMIKGTTIQFPFLSLKNHTKLYSKNSLLL